MHKNIFQYLFVLTISTFAFSQTTLPTPTNIETTYLKNTRAINGAPGKNYWQNSAKYDIAFQFDPNSRLLNGNEEIIYTNNSNDTLKEIVFKLYPNIYKKGSPRLMKIKESDASNGLIIEKMIINDKVIDSKEIFENATNMVIRINPLLPKQSINFKINYSFILNKESHIRTGQVDDGAFFLAYFFPRIAVYDDIDGWNKFPYLGTQEFYNDFCDFKASITVPNDYLVWGTGDLQNCSEVLNDKYCNRIKQAETTDAIQFIVDSSDLKSGGITKSNTPLNTWKFEATNVTDMVMAISNHYVWQSSSIAVDKITKRRTRVDAVYNEKHKDFELVASDARKTVEAMSYSFPKWPYPYSHETVFDGLDQMEYPMMVNDNPLDNRAESIELTDHEIFHTMFPFYMGINETKYGWMDEGWATIGEWLVSPMIDPTIIDEYGIAKTEKTAGTEIDLPIMTLTSQLNDTSMFINSYPKPALGYLYIKDLLGDDLFFKALHHYIKIWNGKHPMPNDFFYSMNEGSGKNLNWFWKKWFFEGGILDLSIQKVNEKEITIENKGIKPLPVDLNITYSDGTTEKIHKNVGVWESGNKTIIVKVKSEAKIQKIIMGSTYVPDSNKKDNIYEN
jgi:hypothetical protein